MLSATRPFPTRPAPYDLQGRTESRLIDYPPGIAGEVRLDRTEDGVEAPVVMLGLLGVRRRTHPVRRALRSVDARGALPGAPAPSLGRLDAQQGGFAQGRVAAEEASPGQHVQQPVGALLDVADALPEIGEQPFPALLQAPAV